MSFQEMSNYADRIGSTEMAPLGAESKPSMINLDALENPKIAIRVRYFVGNLCDSQDRAMVEHIMTNSLNTGGGLSKHGDIVVIREDHNFDRQGDYQVAIKYYEAVSKVKDAPVVEDTVAMASPPKDPVLNEDVSEDVADSEDTENADAELPKHDY